MIIRPVQTSDADEWLRFRMALWPDSDPQEEAREITHFLAIPPRPFLPTLHAAFVCSQPGGRLCGLVDVSIHKQPQVVKRIALAILKHGTLIRIGVVRE